MDINLGLTAQAAGTADAITAVYAPAVISLTDRLTRYFVATGMNTIPNPTFAPNGLPALPITKIGGETLNPGDIPGPGAVCIVQYNLANTSWELLNPAPYVIHRTTTNGAGAQIIASFSVPLNSSLTIRSEIQSIKTAGAGIGAIGTPNAYEVSVRVQNIGGVVTSGTIQSDWTSEGIAIFSISFTITGTTLNINVNGSANNTVSWKSYTRIKHIGQ